VSRVGGALGSKSWSALLHPVSGEDGGMNCTTDDGHPLNDVRTPGSLPFGRFRHYSDYFHFATTSA
jgi:hypothetical protein